MTLVEHIFKRQASPCQSLKKHIVDCLFGNDYLYDNGHHISTSNTVLSLEIDQDNQFLLTGDTGGNVAIYEIFPKHYSTEAEYGDQFITFYTEKSYTSGSVFRAQWFPIDNGLFAYAETRSLGLVDTNNLEMILSMDFCEEKLLDINWNRIDANVMALAFSNPEVRLFDIRCGSAVTSISVNSSQIMSKKAYRQITTVYWLPTDQTGLLVGDDLGEIYLYDTRNLKRALAHTVTDYLLFNPVWYLGVTPDHRDLITCHGSKNEINIWKFCPNTSHKVGQSFLANLNRNFCLPASSRGSNTYNAYSRRLQPYATVDHLFVPNVCLKMGSHSASVFCYDIRTGLRIDKMGLFRRGGGKSVRSVIGYDRTKFGDESTPAMIYADKDCIVWHLMDRPQTEKKVLQHKTQSKALMDRWSDDES